jgi:hypothetical protein
MARLISIVARRLPAAALLAALAPSVALAQAEIQAPDAPQIPVADQMNQAVRIALKALDRGYGQTCDLKAMPAAKGAGYYPCVDIGPYRFVREYANAGYRTAGYLVAGGEPFRFLEAVGSSATLLVKGPWETDLLPRAVKFEEDISGVAAERKRALEPEAKRIEAERRLHDFMTKEKPEGQSAEGGTDAKQGAAR